MRSLKTIVFVALVVILLAPISLAKAGNGGFGDDGYNRTARIFNGSAWQWCMGKFNSESYCTSYLGDYANDMLLMKWNAEWDRGNAEDWANPPYNAWEDNQWNGMFPGGSGETWHYKFVWVGPCGDYGDPVEGGGYCIWGQFAVIMSHGTAGGHFWDVLAKSAGYGAYFSRP